MPHDAGEGFLSPYRALDLTDHRGLLAGSILGRLGADVIQVEPPAGSPARGVGPFAADAPAGANSLYWSAYACGKRGVTCDLDRDEGRSLFLRLARNVDFLFECEGPARMEERGLGLETLRAANPGLIQVSITPFGSDGPKAHYADSELIVWASAGPLWPHRDSAGRPLRISVPQAYLHAAADAAAGALIALFARHATGRGQHVDISAQQSASLATLSATLAAAVGHQDFEFGGAAPQSKKQLDLSGSGARTRRSKWRVRDGLVEMHLGVGPAAGGFANKLFAWMRAEGALPDAYADWDWIRLPGRIRAGEIDEDDLDGARAAVAAFLAGFTKDEVMQSALARGLLMAPAMTVEDLARSEHLRARGFFETVSEGGRARTVPGRFAAGCGGFAPMRPAPTLGEHNHQVYGELLGLAPGEIEALAQRGVI